MRSSTLDPDDLDRPDWNSLKANYSKHDVGEAYLKGRLEQMGLHVEHWGIDMRDHDDHLIFDNKMDLRCWEPLDGQEHAPVEWPDGPTKRWQCFDADPSFVSAIKSHDEVSAAQALGFGTWQCRALIDVKTKSSEEWMCVTNLRHLAHYAEWANEHWAWDIPTAIYFTMVDMDSETVGERNIFVPIPHEWQWEDLVLHYDPDEDYSVSWPNRKKLAESVPIVKEAFPAPDGNDVVRFREDAYENFDWVVSEVL